VYEKESLKKAWTKAVADLGFFKEGGMMAGAWK
jgi:hypothetical protein